MIYTVTFNPALDYVVKAEGVTFGKTNRSSGERIYFGGKGINVSLVLKALGAESTALGFVAGFTGEALSAYLTEQGVKTDFVRLDTGMTRINIKLKGDVETEINASGPDIDEKALGEFYEKLSSVKNGDTVVLAGSVPKSLPRDIYEQILSRLAVKRIKTVVDAEGELLTSTLKYRPYLIKPNRDELEGIFGKALSTDDEIAAAADELRTAGAINVLVSLGKDGALLVDEYGKRHRAYSEKIVAINTVGAGDSAVAGFTFGSETDYETALRYAVACGTATASLPSLADRDTIARFL